MKKENDEITELFRKRLSGAEMPVRDGFWEELERDIPPACRHRRVVFFRVAAAASVLLVLAAASATFLYFSPKEEMNEAFTQVAMSTGGQLNGDGVHIPPLPLPVSASSSPLPASRPLLSQSTEEETPTSVTFSMSFTFSSGSTADTNNRYTGCGNTGYWQETTGNAGASDADTAAPEVKKKASRRKTTTPKGKWAVKLQAGTALPADNGTYKMPIMGGLTVERMLNDRVGIEAGLLYSSLRSAEQHLHYLGIPLKINVTLVSAPKVNLYASVGGVADKCIAGAPDNSFQKEPIQLAVTAGIGVQYKINNRLALFAEPGVSHHFPSDSELTTVRTERRTNFNLLCGLRMTY